MRDPQVYVCGDTHIPIDIYKLNTSNWPKQKELTKDDLLIILGDCGLLWAKDWDNEELFWAKWLAKKKCTVCFIDGNHSNFTRINALEEVNFYGGKAGIAYSDKNGTIYHLKRGEIYKFKEEKILTFGGATSTDKAHRIAYKSWWPEEVYNHEEWKNLIKNLELYNYSVDYILTHTAPTSVLELMPNHNIERINCKVAQALQQVLPHITFNELHFGHMHDVWLSKDMKFFCHYNNQPYRII